MLGTVSRRGPWLLWVTSPVSFPWLKGSRSASHSMFARFLGRAAPDQEQQPNQWVTLYKEEFMEPARAALSNFGTGKDQHTSQAKLNSALGRQLMVCHRRFDEQGYVATEGRSLEDELLMGL